MGAKMRLGLAGLVFLAASGCGGVHRTVTEVKKVRDLANLRLASPEMTVSLKTMEPLFVPEFEYFRGPAGAWGEGRRLGGLWAYSPTDATAVDGLAFVPPSGLLLLQTSKPGGFGPMLVSLDLGGHKVSSHPLVGFFTDLDAGTLGGRQALLAWEGDQLRVLDLAGAMLWTQELPAADALLADLDGSGRGVLAAGWGAAVSAWGADGGRLWSREGIGQVAGLAAGRFGPGSAESLAVFASSGGASSVLILDGQGRTMMSFSDETAPERGVFLRAEGKAVFLAHVGSTFQTQHDRLQVSRLEGGQRTKVAEADLGPTHVLSMAAADLQGDGLKEIILGTDNGWVFVYGQDGRLLGEKHHFGQIVHLACGDVNGDGKDDLLVAARGATSRVYAYAVVAEPGLRASPAPQAEKK